MKKQKEFILDFKRAQYKTWFVMGVMNGLAVEFPSECADHLMKRSVVILQLNHGRRLDALPRGVQHNLPGQISRRLWRRTRRSILRPDRSAPGQPDDKDRHPLDQTDTSVRRAPCPTVTAGHAEGISCTIRAKKKHEHDYYITVSVTVVECATPPDVAVMTI